MITIIGAGIVGPVVACCLAKAGLSVTLIESKSLPVEKDVRAISVAYGCKLFLEKIGIWQHVEDISQPIWEIRVLEKGSAWTVDFEGEEHPLGFIVEYTFLRDAMVSCLDHPNIECFWGTKVESIQREENEVSITLSSGKIISSKIVIGAEGRFSLSRQTSRIQATIKDYGDVALIGTIFHEKSHQNTAWEIFLDQGMLAFLPMQPLADQNRSSFVFFQNKGTDFSKLLPLDEIFKEIFPYYGDIEVEKKTWTYPILSLKTDHIIDHRLALVGDAAHVIHPITGQGANLGWKDAEILCDELITAFQIGLDVGSKIVLERYEKKRKLDHSLLHLSTSGLRSLFRLPHAQFIRNTGLALVNKSPFLKKWIAKHAMKL